MSKDSQTSDRRTAARSHPALFLWPYALVVAVGMIVLLPGLGSYGFWDPWEPKYVQSTVEMIERDSLVVPYYRDEVRLTKPILVYWGIRAGTLVFGMNEFGARFVGVAMTLAAMAAICYVVSLLRSRRAGILSALVLCSIPQVFFLSRQAMPDAYLFTSLGGALLFLCAALFGPDGRRRDVHVAISAACLALAVLAKGPVIVGLVFFVTLAVYAVARLDVPRLWRPPLRRPTLSFAAVSVPAAAATGAAAVVAFLFGTSSVWWGYSDDGREDVEETYEAVLGIASRWHLAELLLALAVGAAALGAFLLFRRGGLARWPGRIGGAVAAVVIVVAVAAFFADTEAARLLVAATLWLGGSLAALIGATWRYLRHPALRPEVDPWLKPLGRQLLLFAGVFALVAGPWHLAIVIKEGHGYFTDFIIKHNLQRASEEINSSGDASYYFKVLIYGLFPWSCLLPAALAAAVAWGGRHPLKRYGLEAILLLSIIVAYAAFGSSETKFSHYFAPTAIPLAVLIGLLLHRMLAARRTAIVRLSWMVAAMLFFVPMMDILEREGMEILLFSFTRKTWVDSDADPGKYYALLLVGFLLLLLCSVLVRSRLLVGGLVTLALLMAQYSTATFIPAVSPHKTMKSMCESWERYRQGDAPIGLFGSLKHGLYYYTGSEFDRISGGSRGFVKFMDPARPAFCVLERSQMRTAEASFRKDYPGQDLFVIDDTHGRFILLANHPVEGRNRVLRKR